MLENENKYKMFLNEPDQFIEQTPNDINNKIIITLHNLQHLPYKVPDY